MLGRRLQRLRRIGIQVERPGQRAARRRQQALRQLCDRLVHVSLAHRLHRQRRRHHLRLNLRQRCIRRCRNHPVLRADSAVTQVVNRCVIFPSRRRAQVRRQVHAEKTVRRNRHRHRVGDHGLARCRRKPRPANDQCPCSRLAVRQIHRALYCRRSHALGRRHRRQTHRKQAHRDLGEEMPPPNSKTVSHPRQRSAFHPFRPPRRKKGGNMTNLLTH